MNNQTAKKWLQYAFDDLSWTEANLKEGVWYGACFTAQQTVEKSLKAYLINNGSVLKKVHDLGALLEECIKLDDSFSVLKEHCVILTDYYAPSRYPDMGEFMDFTKEKAEEAYKFAKEITSFVKDKIQ